MSTLDRYIARQYLFNIGALLALLFSFVVAVDVALNIDIFLASADKWMAAEAGAGEPAGGPVRRVALAAVLVVDLWWPRLLQLFGYLVGLILIAAMGFTFTQMVRHREMVAVLAGGVSLYRLARPVIVVAALVLGVKIINQELILSRPEIAPLLMRSNDDLGRRDWSESRVKLMRDARNRIFLAQSFDPSAGTLNKLTVFERDEGGMLKRVIAAEEAKWRDGGWDLVNPVVQGTGLLPAGGKDGPGGSGSDGVPRRLETDLDPQTLKLNQYASFSQTLSWGQIGEMLASPLLKPEMRDRLQRIRWSRVSQSASIVLSLIVAMPFYLVREPRNMLAQTLKCAPIGISALMGGILLSLLPWPGLPPGFATFIPVFVLCPVAVAMVSWLKT